MQAFADEDDWERFPPFFAYFEILRRYKAEMANNKTHLEVLKKNLVQHNLQIKAIIQDISAFHGSLENLKTLNNMGRNKLSLMRKDIEQLEQIARDSTDNKLMADVESNRQQLSSMYQSFKNANVQSLIRIEKEESAELLGTDKVGNQLRNRAKVDKSGLLSMSTGLTDQLLTISRRLAETTQRSQETLDNLILSSNTINGTKSELENTASGITQSSSLLKKYGRREVTDKIIMIFAFLFFLSCVFYIVHKRLF